jgi:XRE family transcriptional regulator, regulator of sulfur utilization
MTPSEIDIGANIRAFRQKKKLSLNELSRLTGISASNLSSMELGKSSPTLSTLTKVAAAFDMKPGAFLDEVLYNKAVLCRRADVQDKLLRSNDDSLVCALTANVHTNQMDSSLMLLKSHGAALPAGREGSDRFLYCLAGEVKATVDDEVYDLRQGDGLYLLPEARAELHNRSSTEASLLLVTLKCRRGL